MTNFNRVNPGDKVGHSATMHNAFVAAAQSFQQTAISGGSKGRKSIYPSTIVSVKNESGGDVDRFEIMRIDDVIFDPSTSLASFQNHPSFIGITPDGTHDASFVIAIEPIKDDATGKCMISGICPVRVSVSSETHEFAYMDTTIGWLNSTSTDGARILWKEAGTGSKWAIVRLGDWQKGDLPPANEFDMLYHDGDDWAVLGQPTSPSGNWILQQNKVSPGDDELAWIPFPSWSYGGVVVGGAANWQVLTKPSSDGDYVMRTNVASGNPTPSWLQFPVGVDGDMIVSHGDGDWRALNKPSEGNYILQTSVNSFDDPTTSWIKFPSGSDGDIVYHNGTDWIAKAKPSDGTWVLQCVVTGGNPIISWVATTECS